MTASRWTGFALALLLVTTPVGAGPLVGLMPFSLGPTPCDGVLHAATWTQTVAPMIYVRALRMWFGTDGPLEADIQGMVHRASDAMPLAIEPFDHYRPTNGLTSTTFTYAPDYIVLTAGDMLVLHTLCHRGSTTPLLACGEGRGCYHIAVTIWYLRETPP